MSKVRMRTNSLTMGGFLTPLNNRISWKAFTSRPTTFRRGGSLASAGSRCDQLAAEGHTSNFVSKVQQEVHNFYAERCDPAFQSLRNAASLMGSTNAEDHALLLTSIRRAVKAAADYHYPPQSDLRGTDGKRPPPLRPVSRRHPSSRLLSAAKRRPFRQFSQARCHRGY
jgi:hypothetical protein